MAWSTAMFGDRQDFPAPTFRCRVAPAHRPGVRKRSTFDIVGPDGRRATVTPRSDSDTVGDLVLALGHQHPAPIRVDGQPAAVAQRLVDVPALRTGASVELGIRPAPPDGGGPPAAVVEIAVIAGPSCRSWTPLGPGRHTIGRSVHCAVRLDDELAELHHAVFDVDGDGAVRFTQLTGRVPARLDGEPCEPRAPIAAGAVLEIGASLLTLRPIQRAADGGGRAECGGSIVAGPDPWRRADRKSVV